MPYQSARLGLDKFNKYEEYSHSDTVNHVDETAPLGLEAAGTFTASGGASPAAEHAVTGVSTTQTVALRCEVGVDADPQFDGDYGFNYDVTRTWVDADSQWDVTITVNWDTDPGDANDVTLTYRIYAE